MTPIQALQLLDQATQPGAHIDRMGYVQIQEALKTIHDALKALEAKQCEQ